MIDAQIFKTHMFCPARTIGYVLVERGDAEVRRPVYKFGVPMFLWGPPGIAKTEMSRQLAEAFGLKFRAEYAAQRDPAEINGMYTVGADGELRQNLPPWAQACLETPSVCLFDELPLAAKATQDAVLTTINDSNVGGVYLPHTRFIAAGNDAKIGGGREPTAAMANRFGHYECRPDASAWCEWMIGGGDMGGEVEAEDAAKTETYVTDHFDEPYARQRGLIVGFVRQGGTDEVTIGTSHLFSMPDRSDPRSRRAWLSPRSLEKVARMRATAQLFGLTESQVDEITAALIGADKAAMLAQFEADSDMPNVGEWLDGKAAWEFNPQRPDRAVSLFSAAASMLIPESCTRRQERAKTFWQKIDPIAEDHPDLVLMAASSVAMRKLPNGSTKPTGLAQLPEAQPTLRKLRPILVAVGMLKSRG